jgi:hypothetical protein
VVAAAAAAAVEQAHGGSSWLDVRMLVYQGSMFRPSSVWSKVWNLGMHSAAAALAAVLQHSHAFIQDACRSEVHHCVCRALAVVACWLLVAVSGFRRGVWLQCWLVASS